jgi:hypothetical protein
MLRPASWLALLSRTFTFELSLAGSPRANVEYNYVDKQSIPTAGLSPASPTALWAAVPDLTPSMTPSIGIPRPLEFLVVLFANAEPRLSAHDSGDHAPLLRLIVIQPVEQGFGVRVPGEDVELADGHIARWLIR